MEENKTADHPNAADSPSEAPVDNVRYFGRAFMEEHPRLRRITLADLTRIATLVSQHDVD